MKKIIMIIALLSFRLAITSQNYDSSNSLARVALVYYVEDENGYFQKKENINLQEVVSIVSTYGYNKKSHELYVETNKANCIVTVNENLHKVLKKSKIIPQLKQEELTVKVNAVNQEMAERFERLNLIRQKHIADSIELVRQDSIRKVREDSIRVIEAQRKADNYRKSHNWKSIPTKNTNLYCTFCEENVKQDSIDISRVSNDTIYWLSLKDGYLYNFYGHMHAAKIPISLKNDEQYKYHCEVFADSLSQLKPTSLGDARTLNTLLFLDYLENLKKEAPNGFFLDWGWDSEYSSIEFHFNYMNTNKNTIKYIEVFFVVTNDVGDVRKTGSFKGTGPLKEWESAKWNWDHSSYYVAGDASKMNISKVIITYMNGTKVTIPKNKLHFN